MTTSLKRKFEETCQEIDVFFKALKELDENTLTRALLAESSFNDANRQIWFKTLKGSAFLLLYNLVESTVRDAVEGIYLQLSEEEVEFDQCIPEIKKIFLKNLKNHNTDKIEPKLKKIANHIISETYDLEKIIPGGNVDAKTIRELAKTYGFTEPRSTRGDCLKEIKDKRNDLAHGVKRFSEIGRDSTGQQLLDKKRHIVESLGQLINEIEKYLLDKKYLNP